MNLDELLPLLTDHYVWLGIGIAVGLLFWLIRWVRSILTSERPDDALSNLGMLVGLGWSSEAVWTLTGKDGADLITPIRIALFAVFEVILIVFMIRAKRNQRLLGHPGRSGKYAWVVAAGMSLVAVWTAHNAGEAFLRLLVPLLLTLQWWDGLVGEGAKKDADPSSWRWTPRRLLLWLGAIEPGERDIETVHRERLTQQMTQLEFRRRHGSGKKRDRAARRLSQLSLGADDDLIADVRARVDRATWFKTEPVDAPAAGSTPGVPAAEAWASKRARVGFRSPRRSVCRAHPRQVVVAAAGPVQDERTTQDVELVVRAIKQVDPGSSRRRMAFLAATTEAKIRKALQPSRGPELTQINGRKPDFVSAE